jgi:hypothetical protein
MDNDTKLDKLTEALKGIKTAEFSWEEESDNLEPGITVQEIQPLNTEQIDAILSGGSSYNYPYGNVTISSASSGLNGAYLYSTASSSGAWPVNTNAYTTNVNPNTTLEVTGDLMVKGKNIGNILDKIQDRLAILDEPNLEKLEKHAALKKAYNHYKLMEKLIGED